MTDYKNDYLKCLRIMTALSIYAMLFSIIIVLMGLAMIGNSPIGFVIAMFIVGLLLLIIAMFHYYKSQKKYFYETNSFAI